MSGTASPATYKPLTRRENSLKVGSIGKLPDDQRLWSDNVLRVLKLPHKGSQARMMAGAIATTEKLKRENSPHYQEAVRLRDTVTAAGTPPWKDGRKAAAATSAKMKLDLLSLPSPQLAPLNPNAVGINAAFWINRQDAGNQISPSFLCKPADVRAHNMQRPEGIPPGGDAPREALSSRAAQLIFSQTGIDIGMPESNVVDLDSNLLPQGSRPAGGGPVMCSLQEARPNKGALKSVAAMQRASFDRDQVAGLALFDTMTLNSDRHSGNLLVGDDNRLIPIDHGASMLEPFRDEFDDTEKPPASLIRISDTMGGPHNALLALPAAHDPLSPKLLKKMRAIDPDAFAKGLKKERGQIEGAAPEAAGKISDAAIESSRRSTLFVKLAARNKPPLTPAAMQIALAGSACELLDPAIDDKEFRRRAQAAINRMAAHQGTIKQVCLAPDGEFEVLLGKAGALGWDVQGRGVAPKSGAIGDPVLILAIIKRGLSPTLGSDVSGTVNDPVIAQARQASISPEDAADMLLQNQKDAVAQLTILASDDERRKVPNRMRQIGGLRGSDQQAAYGLLLDELTRSALSTQRDRLRQLEQRQTFQNNNSAIRDARAAAQEDKPIALAACITAVLTRLQRAPDGS